MTRKRINDRKFEREQGQCLSGSTDHPERTGNRWQQKVNGEMKGFYELVRPLQPDAPQTQEGSGGIKTDAEKAAAETPPVVKGGRFAGFLFGEEDR